MPTPTIEIRASSLGSLFDCPARWEATHINKIRMPSSSTATLGKAVHAGTALYDTSVIEGTGLTIDDTCGVVVDAIHKPNEDVAWGDDSPKEAENIALDLHRLYCKDIAPKQTYVAVEAKCERLEITDIGIALTGTIDRVRKTIQGHGITDIKTGKAAVAADGTVKTQGHAAQLAVYELLAESATGIPMDAPAQIAGLQVAKTAKGQRAATGEVTGTRTLLIGNEERPGLLQMASSLIHSGIFYGNPKSMLCHKSYCPIFLTCKWRGK